MRLTVSAGEPPFDWTSQKRQYPPSGETGIGYFAGETEYGVVDCLLWRDQMGILRGVLNHYSFPTPFGEHAGSVNIYVDPLFRRRGVATMLLDEARTRWVIDVEAQTYTEAGADFMVAYLDAGRGG